MLYTSIETKQLTTFMLCFKELLFNNSAGYFNSHMKFLLPIKCLINALCIVDVTMDTR